MADFAAVDDVAKVLLRSITDADEIASVTLFLGIVSDEIRKYTEQLIELVENDEVSLNGPRHSSKLLLPEIPVVSVASVYENGTLLSVDDDYVLDPDTGILHRVGRVWRSGIQNIVVTYNHGFAEIPQSIVGVCARSASRQFQAALKSSENDGVPGVASKALGDFSVSFATDTAEGQMGASAARILLLSEKDILDKFKAK